MSKQIFEKGTVKVVWIEGDNDKVFFSKMFDNLSEAQTFAKTKEDCIVFKLLSQKDLREFSWEIIPSGKSKLLKKAIKIYLDNKNRIDQLLKLIS